MSLSPEQAATFRHYFEQTSFATEIRTLVLARKGCGVSRVLRTLHGGPFEPECYDPTLEEGWRLFSSIQERMVVFGITQLYNGDLVRSRPSAYRIPRDSHAIRHADTFFLLYDVTSRASFELLEQGLTYIHQERALPRGNVSCGLWCPPRPQFDGVLFVIATKIDRDKSDWEVSTQEGEAFSDRMGAIYLQVSPKTGEGTGRNVLDRIARDVLLRKIEHDPRITPRSQPTWKRYLSTSDVSRDTFLCKMLKMPASLLKGTVRARSKRTKPQSVSTGLVLEHAAVVDMSDSEVKFARDTITDPIYFVQPWEPKKVDQINSIFRGLLSFVDNDASLIHVLEEREGGIHFWTIPLRNESALDEIRALPGVSVATPVTLGIRLIVNIPRYVGREDCVTLIAASHANCSGARVINGLAEIGVVNRSIVVGINTVEQPLYITLLSAASEFASP